MYFHWTIVKVTRHTIFFDESLKRESISLLKYEHNDLIRAFH